MSSNKNASIFAQDALTCPHQALDDPEPKTAIDHAFQDQDDCHLDSPSCLGLPMAKLGINMGNQEISETLKTPQLPKSFEQISDIIHGNASGILTSQDAVKLIENGFDHFVSTYIKKFTNLGADIAYRLVGENANNIFCVLNFYSQDGFGGGLDLPTLFAKLPLETDAKLSDAVVENLDGLQITGELLANVLRRCTVQYSTAYKISRLDLELLLGEDEAASLRQHIKTIKPDLGDIEYANPYAEIAGDIEHVTMTLPGTELHARASVISRELEQEMSADWCEQTDRARSLIASYEKLQANITDKYNAEYASQIFGDRGKYGDMMPIYRRLVADYTAVGGMQESEMLSNWDLRSATQAFENVLEDTVYYDKLFLEWDAKRVSQRDFQEVFIGRDGVYAYVGRRAQILARRRRSGLQRLDQQMDDLDLPTYLIYPRDFIYDLDREAKTVYLQQNIKNPESAYYFDTGYHGTVPENIMSTLGVPCEQSSKRIRLLSSTTEKQRTVVGLGDNIDKRHAVECIEGSAKDENMASGVWIHKNGDNEELMPYANPKSAYERLAFRMMQLALHRHYYSKEMNQKTPQIDQFTRHELGTHEIRINASLDSEYKQQLVDLFSDEHDSPGTLRDKAKIIKNPYDRFRNAAFFELNLPENGNIIIKNVIASNDNGPIDEFEALLLLKASGIDTPRPLACVFNEDGAMIVIEKPAGIYGLEIEEYFKDHKVEATQRQKILDDALSRMQVIADAVRRDVGIDKAWRLKDFMIELDDESNIQAMRPIDFEKSQVFNPASPCAVRY